ncbi:MAG: tetratricopeptide repeat protein [Nitrospira sp.]|jgi:tetratricopeptide (TPR) repeat protein
MAPGSKKTGNAAEIDRLALAFAKEPGSKVFIPLAEEYGKAGMWEEAVAVLEDGLKTYPGFITAMVALGRAYEQMNQPIKAKAILEEAIKVSPDNLRAHRTLAKLYVAQGAKEAAIRSCNVILAVNPQDQEALSLRAGLDASAVDGASEAQGQSPEKSADTASLESDPIRGEPVTSTLSDATLPLNNEADTSSGPGTCPEAGPVSATAVTTPSAQVTGNPTVTQLEQWLTSIQARRRDSPALSRSSPKTSS